MDRLIIEKYIKENKHISVPEIQFKFSLSYKETRALFQELESKELIQPEDDIYYLVLSQDKVSILNDDNEEDTDYFNRRMTDADRRRAEIRLRREELKRRMDEIHLFADEDEDEEDDADEDEDDETEDKDDDEGWDFIDEDDDEDDQAIDERIRKILKKISAEEEPSEDSEDDEETDDEEEEEETDEEETDKDDTAIREFKEITFEDVEKYRTLAKIVMSFSCSGQFVREGSDYFCKLGIAYPDDTEIYFKLSYVDKITLSDCGGTYRFLSKYFNISESNILKRIKNIMNDYGLKLRKVDDKTELYIQIQDEDSAFMSFLWLFSAIERLTVIHSEGLLSVVSDDYDSFCKSELVRIVIDGEASFSAAKACAQELYIQALEEGNTLKKNAYKNIVAALDEVTEEGYERFKREILGEEEE